MKRILSSTVCICVAMLALASGTLRAAEPLTIKIADHFPVDHIVPRLLTKDWMARVTELTGGKVTFSYFPGEQLVKQREALPALQRGIIDIALVNPGLFPTEFALTGVSFLPGGYDDNASGGPALQKLYEYGPVRQEFVKAGVTPLLIAPLDAFEIMARKRVRLPEDVKGLRLRTGGEGQVAAVRALGGVSVTLSGPEVYTGIQRGTVEGTLFPYGVAKAYRLNEVAQFGEVGAKIASGSIFYAVSAKFWNGLDPAYRQAILTASAEKQPVFWAKYDGEKLETIKSFRAGGMTIDDVSSDPASRAAWEKALKGVGDEWAGKMDAKGLPGSDVLRTWHVLTSPAPRRSVR